MFMGENNNYFYKEQVKVIHKGYIHCVSNTFVICMNRMLYEYNKKYFLNEH